MVITSNSQSQSTPGQKKRHGQHHKTTKPYIKTYWPYLPMLMLVGLGFLLNSFWTSHGSVLSYATSVSTTSLLQETNIQRTNNGKTALSLNTQLNQAAQEKANDMAARNYWSHTTPEGRQPWEFVSATGYDYTYAGENLAYGFGNSSEAIAGWMNSQSHRDNVLSSNYKDVGFGYANVTNYQQEGEQTIIVAMYAAPKAISAPAPVTITKVQPSVKAAEPTLAPVVAEVPVPAQPTTSPVVPASTPAHNDTATPSPQSQQPAMQAQIEQLNPQRVSRIDVLTDGNAQWAALSASLLVTIAAISLAYRHGKMWKRYIVKGEHFIIKHPLYDIAVVAAIVVSVLLTRTSGIIQ